MKKISFNKYIIIAFCIGLLVIISAVFIALNSNKDGVLSVLDSEGNIVATVNQSGDSFEIVAENEAYSEYIEIAVKEAASLYFEKENISSEVGS